MQKKFTNESLDGAWRRVLKTLEIGDDIDDPEPMSALVAKILIFMATAMGMILIVSNLAALKIWRLALPWPEQLWPLKVYALVTLPVDAGILLFPFSYAIGDIMVEIFGQKVANLVAVYSAIFAIFAAAILLVAKVMLPDYPGADNSGFVVVQSATGRIFIASVLGFLISQIVNNHVFVQLRKMKSNGNFRERALLSSIVARVFDIAVFEVLAFLGKLSLKEFFMQAIFAYIAGVVIEFLISTPTKKFVQRLISWCHYDNGKVVR